MMKTRVSSTLAALILSAPALSFAQQAGHQPTRAEVKAEMARLAAVGYTPALDHNQYPAAILAAEKRVRENAVAQGAPNAAPVAVAHQSRDDVPGRDEPRDHRSADVAGRARHEHPEAFHPLLRARDGPCGTRPARCRASQYRRPAPAPEGKNH